MLGLLCWVLCGDHAGRALQQTLEGRVGSHFAAVPLEASARRNNQMPDSCRHVLRHFVGAASALGTGADVAVAVWLAGLMTAGCSPGCSCFTPTHASHICSLMQICTCRDVAQPKCNMVSLAKVSIIWFSFSNARNHVNSTLSWKSARYHPAEPWPVAFALLCWSGVSSRSSPPPLYRAPSPTRDGSAPHRPPTGPPRRRAEGVERKGGRRAAASVLPHAAIAGIGTAALGAFRVPGRVDARARPSVDLLRGMCRCATV